MDILHPELFESVKCKVDIVVDGELTRGMSVVQMETEGNVKVLLHGNRDQMIHYFLEDLKILDERFRRK
jgi:inosine-uridine nucleoside N-ribohydrolase